jgi:hypothetical protein
MPEHYTFIPIIQASSSPVFRHRSPSSAPDSVRASPPSAPSCERPPSCSIPQLTAASSPSGLPRAAGPLHARRRPPELPTAVKCRRPTQFVPPHCRHTVLVCPCPLLLARHRPYAPLKISGNTLPPLSHRRARHHVVPRALQRATHAVFPAGLGCQAMAQPAFWPTARGRPPRSVGCSLEPVSAQYCARRFKCFSIVLNSKNHFKLQKFIETYTNVQKLQNKFYWTPLEPLFTVGLSKLTFR